MASFFPTSTTECYVTKHVRNSEILENDCFEYGDADVAGPRCRFAANCILLKVLYIGLEPYMRVFCVTGKEPEWEVGRVPRGKVVGEVLMSNVPWITVGMKVKVTAPWRTYTWVEITPRVLVEELDSMDFAESIRLDENMRRSEKARIGGRRTASAAIWNTAPASPDLGSATMTIAPAAAAAAAAAVGGPSVASTTQYAQPSIATRSSAGELFGQSGTAIAQCITRSSARAKSAPFRIAIATLVDASTPPRSSFRSVRSWS